MAHLLRELDTPDPSSRTSTPQPQRSKEPTAPNVLEVVLGNWWIKPWYPSFYPEELVGKRCERLYVCQWCFKYTRDVGAGYLGHMEICAYRNITSQFGPAMYTSPSTSTPPSFSIHTLDGSTHTLFAQNLSLFAKLFLDTKSVFYDVTTFLFYILVSHTPSPQIVGFFSKEKLSWDNNNLACILIFPPWQKKGYGQVLMASSYVLARREGRLGGPEKPLSDLGRRSYFYYWSGAICRHVLGVAKNRNMTVAGISEATWIVPEDIVGTLAEMGVLEHKGATVGKRKGGGGVVVNKARVREWMARNKVSARSPVEEARFVIEEFEDEDEE